MWKFSEASMAEDGKYFDEQLGTDRGFIITYSTVTSESAENGDTATHGYSDYNSCEPDEFDTKEGINAVDKAVEYLQDKGATNASSSRFHPGIWYSTEYATEDYSTDEQTQYDFHPKNFTTEEQAEIFKVVTK